MTSAALPALLRPAPLRRRLWQGGIALLLFIGTLAAGNFFVKPDKALDRHSLGQDFLAFYTAGTFAREHRFDDLYDLDKVKQFQHEVARNEQLDLGDAFGPFWNPPFYAWIFAPLSLMSFYHAVMTWTAINVLALVAAMWLLCRMLPVTWHAAPLFEGWLAARRDWRNWMLVPLILLVSMPLIQSLSHGQNTCVSLLILCLLVTAWRNKEAELAGMACGLMFYKPQLAAVLAVIVTINLGARALAGMAFIGGILFVVSTMAMPGSFDNYLHQLPQNLRYMQVEHTYLWERHVTLRALWRLLLQGYGRGEASLLVQSLTYLSCGVLGILLVRAAFRSRRAADEPWTGETAANSRDRLIAATVATMPLLMPFYFDYDLLLLAVPAVLVAAELMQRDEPRGIGEHLLLRIFALMFLWLMVNPGIARLSEVNGTTILLLALSLMLVLRASRHTIVGGDNVIVDVGQLEMIYRNAA